MQDIAAVGVVCKKSEKGPSSLPLYVCNCQVLACILVFDLCETMVVLTSAFMVAEGILGTVLCVCGDVILLRGYVAMHVVE